MEAKIYWDLCQTYQNLYSLNESYQEIVEETYPEDIVVGYLLDEGYASCFEDAEVIMANMSDRWFDLIVESETNLDDLDLKGHEELVSKLKAEILELRKRHRTVRPGSPEHNNITKKLASLSAHLSNAVKSLDQLRIIHDKPKPERRGEGPKPRDPGDALTPEERQAMRDTQITKPTGTKEQRQATQERTAANAAAMRSGRVGTLTGGRPQTNRDDVPNTVSSTNRRAAKAGEGILGDRDPVSGRRQVYYDPETGAPQRLISTSQTANRQIRSGATRRERRSGATTQRGEFHSTTGAGLRGSTQERRTGPEGEGRRPNQG